MSLYTITEDLLAVIDGGMVVDEETGEIVFDSENLEQLEEEYANKLEGCGLYCKNLSAEIDALREEERSLAARRKSKEGKLERLKEYMLRSMEATNTERIETSKVLISTRKSQRVIVDDERKIPLQFLKVTQTVNKADLKKALKSGDIEGAHIEESVSLQLK